jgi:hypothetical protein
MQQFSYASRMHESNERPQSDVSWLSPESRNLTVIVFLSFASILVAAVDAGKEEVPNNIADSVGGALNWTEDQFLAAAEAFLPRN